MLTPTKTHTQRLLWRDSQAFQPCFQPALHTRGHQWLETHRQKCSFLTKKILQSKVFFMHPSWLVDEIILLVNTFENKRVMAYNTVTTHLHGRSCTCRPESWCGVDAWVPQIIYCKTAAAGKGKCSKTCRGRKLSQIRQRKVKADLNTTSSQFFTPLTFTPECLLVRCIHVNLLNFVPTYNSVQISNWCTDFQECWIHRCSYQI